MVMNPASRRASRYRMPLQPQNATLVLASVLLPPVELVEPSKIARSIRTDCVDGPGQQHGLLPDLSLI